MGEALHIFRKDVRALWPQILIALAAATLPVFIRDEQQSDKLIALLTLARWFLVISAVHQEKLTGDREWWLTRPNSRKSLLGAKLMFIAAFVQLPLLLCDLAILAANGLAPAWGRLAMRQVQLAFALILPAAAVAAITPGLASCGIAILAMLMVIIFPGATHDVVSNWGPLMWVPPVLTIAVIGVSAVLLLFWQYSRRSTIPPAGALGAATALCAVILVLPPAGWGIALASHTAPAVESVRVDWNEGTPPSVVQFNPGEFALTLPVVLSGYPDDMLIQFDLVHLSLETGNQPIWNSGWHAAYPSSNGWIAGVNFTDSRHAEIVFFIHQNARERAQNQGVSCNLSIVMTVLGPDQSQTVGPVNGVYHVPELGVCTPERHITAYPILNCRNSRPPEQEVAIRESGFSYTRPGDWLTNISLTPSPVWATAAGLWKDWTGEPVTFRMRSPIARIRRSLVHQVGPGDYRQ